MRRREQKERGRWRKAEKENEPMFALCPLEKGREWPERERGERDQRQKKTSIFVNAVPCDKHIWMEEDVRTSPFTPNPEGIKPQKGSCDPSVVLRCQ